MKAAHATCLCLMLIAAGEARAQHAVIGPDEVNIYSLQMIEEQAIREWGIFLTS